MKSQKKEKPVLSRVIMVKTGKIFSSQLLKNGQRKLKTEPRPLDLISYYQRFLKLELI